MNRKKKAYEENVSREEKEKTEIHESKESDHVNTEKPFNKKNEISMKYETLLQTHLDKMKKYENYLKDQPIKELTEILNTMNKQTDIQISSQYNEFNSHPASSTRQRSFFKAE